MSGGADTERLRVSHEDANEISELLKDFAARRRADGAVSAAHEIQRQADGLVHAADSNWRDCGDCGWVGTYLADEELRCAVCDWSWPYMEAQQ